MRANLYGTRSKRQRTVLLCLLSLVLLVSVYCGKDNGKAEQEEAKTEASEAVNRPAPQPLATIKKCAMCGKEITGITASRITVDKDNELNACCAFCTASIKKRIGQQTFEAVTVCYSTGEKIDFKKAFFVVESDETPCCTPSVLAFVSMEEAEAFAREKNGRIMNIVEVMDYVKGITVKRR